MITKQLIFIALGMSSALPLFCAQALTISLTPQWQPIGHGKAAMQQFGGSWVSAGIITIKKRINETLSLSNVTFKWHGPKLAALSATLYRKQGEPFLAIEDNVVSDGVWKPAQQLLSFTFTNKQILDPITTFYLVLTVPKSTEALIKKGSFELLSAYLPAQVQSYVGNASLMLSLNKLNQTKKITIAQR